MAEGWDEFEAEAWFIKALMDITFERLGLFMQVCEGIEEQIRISPWHRNADLELVAIRTGSQRRDYIDRPGERTVRALGVRLAVAAYRFYDGINRYALRWPPSKRRLPACSESP